MLRLLAMRLAVAAVTYCCRHTRFRNCQRFNRCRRCCCCFYRHCCCFYRHCCCCFLNCCCSPCHLLYQAHQGLLLAVSALLCRVLLMRCLSVVVAFVVFRVVTASVFIIWPATFALTLANCLICAKFCFLLVLLLLL